MANGDAGIQLERTTICHFGGLEVAPPQLDITNIHPGNQARLIESQCLVKHGQGLLVAIQFHQRQTELLEGGRIVTVER